MERSVRERARMERVRVLLRTRNEDYPTPRSLSIPSTPSGPVSGRKVRCPVCQGAKVRGHKNVVVKGREEKMPLPCERCNARGWFDIDSYTGVVADGAAQKPEPMTASKRESELQRLATSLKLSAGETDPNESYGWEKAMERRDKAGSYRELERCLEHLRIKDLPTWEHLVWIYSSGLEVEHDGRKEEETIALLASWMPSKIKLPRHLARELAKKREDLILSLSKKQVDHETIAEVACCSVSTVRKIIGTGRPANIPQSVVYLKSQSAASAA